MKYNNWTHVVLTPFGQFLPLNEGDDVVSSLW